MSNKGARIMHKSDIEFHGSEPAVNVKVTKSIRDVTLPMHLGRSRGKDETDWRVDSTDSGFTHEWIEDYLNRRNHYEYEFEFATEQGWEMLQSDAEYIWPGRNVRVYSEGRSGGWAVVHGLTDVESWDAIDVAKWAKFAKLARMTADDVPYQMVYSIYMNAYEPTMIEPLTGVVL